MTVAFQSYMYLITYIFFCKARMFKGQESTITLDHNSQSIGGPEALFKKSQSTFSNEFEQIESGFSTPIEFENLDQESDDPPLSEELHHAIVNMENLNGVRI